MQENRPTERNSAEAKFTVADRPTETKAQMNHSGFKGLCQYSKERKSLKTKTILSLLILTHIWPKINFLCVWKTLSGNEKEREEAVVTFLTWLYFLGL